MLRVLYHGTHTGVHIHDTYLFLYRTYHDGHHEEILSNVVKIEHYEVYYDLNGAKEKI